MKSSLKIFTSCASKEKLAEVTKEGYLPVFAIRHLNKTSHLRRYSNAPIHLRFLAPSEHLLKAHDKGEIESGVFEKMYVIEMSKVCFQDVIKRLEYLAEYNNASGIVIMTPGTSAEHCYRKALGMILNYSGLLETPITEYDVKQGD